MAPTIDINLKVLDPRIGTEWPLPEYETLGAAALDLRACILTPTLTLGPGDTQLVPTGIAIHIADPGVAGIILPRSYLGHQCNLVLGNGTGLIDSDYQGQIMLSIWNRGNGTFVIREGSRLAQILFIPVLRALFHQVKEFGLTDRGAKGFGSTGID